MASTGPALSTQQVVELLDRDFAGALDWSMMQATVLTAVADLRGSISAEALHEMAYRLARHRLASQANPKPAPAGDLVGAGRR